jgi:putative acetyltransferase
MSDSILFYYKDLAIRPWAPPDRPPVAELIATILAEYGLGWEPQGADRDVLDIETCYTAIGGEFWVIERDLQVVGTAAYYPVARAPRSVEIRKMYFLPAIRGQGLGRFLLAQLEAKIAAQGFREIWIETASVLKAAVQLYETSGYTVATGIETLRCDRIYCKRL